MAPVLSEPPPPPVLSELPPPPVVSEPPPPPVLSEAPPSPAAAPPASRERSPSPLAEEAHASVAGRVFSGSSQEGGASFGELDALRDEVASLKLQIKKKERESHRSERLLNEYEEELDSLRATFGLPDAPFQVRDVLAALLKRHPATELIQIIQEL